VRFPSASQPASAPVTTASHRTRWARLLILAGVATASTIRPPHRVTTVIRRSRLRPRWSG